MPRKRKIQEVQGSDDDRDFWMDSRGLRQKRFVVVVLMG